MARMVSPAALPSAGARRPDRSRPPPPRPSFEPAPPRDRAAHAPGVGESPARARGDTAQRRARRAPDAALRSRARAGVEVVVLDRPNPLGGAVVEGNVPDPAFASFVGLYPLPARPGLTLGELARWLALEHGLGGRLSVVEMRGWRRAMLWEDTGVPWVAPSPNMPTPDTARVYPGGCLYEGTNLSEGRGTTRPFEWVGAPYLDAHAFADDLNRCRLPGVHFRPARFVPTFHKWAGRLCGGVQIHVTHAASFKPFITGLAVVASARRLGRRAFRWRRPPYEFEHRKLPI